MTGLAPDAPPASGVHLCAQRPLSRGPAMPRIRRSDRPVVDVHCHYIDDASEAIARGLDSPIKPPPAGSAAYRTAAYNRELITQDYRPALGDISIRLDEMDAMGVDVQALSPSPTQYYYWATEEASREMVASQNTRIAEECAALPDRFVGLGTLSLQHPRSAVEQARYAMSELGLKGFEISSVVNGLPIDDPSLDPVWRELDDLQAVVLLHPLGTSAGPRLDDYYLSNIIGQPLETTIALSRLILGGHLDRYRRVRLCAVHGGGYLPLYFERADHAWRVRPESCACADPPSSYLKRLWFDTLVYEPEHLRRLLDVVGADRMVVGTDYPFDMGHYDPVGLVESVRELTDLQVEAILGGNACELFDFKIGVQSRAAPPIEDCAGLNKDTTELSK